MENVILSDKEIQSTPASSYPTSNEYYILVGCKAGQRKLLRILKEPCTEHYKEDKKNHYDHTIVSKTTIDHRYLCPDCLEEIENAINK